MAYYINQKIASVNKLNAVTLAHNPHFLHFDTVSTNHEDPLNLSLTIENTSFENYSGDYTVTITEKESREKHSFTGTYDNTKVNNLTFLIVQEGSVINESGETADEESAKSLTAQNLKECFMSNSYLRNNFEITSGITTDYQGNITGSNIITLKAKGNGIKYDININILPSEGFIAVTPSGISRSSMVVSDSIDYGSGKYQVYLDVYTQTGVFLGEDDSLTDENRGKYLTTLSKAYHEKSIWFDLNTLFGKKTAYFDSFLNSNGWKDAGTVTDFRVTGRRSNGINNELFYSSEVLYVINGYDYTLNDNNLEEYIFDVVNYDGTKIRPLTTRVFSQHMKGQKHYFGFILKDELHTLSIPGFYVPESQIGLIYRYYTQSGEFISEETLHEQSQKRFDIVNCIELGLDDLIEVTEAKSDNTIGRVEVMLSCNGNAVSEALQFDIIPEDTYSLKDFAFLNRLGGWDTFNFGNSESVEFKTSNDLFYQTLLPGYATHSRIENMSRKSVSEQMTVRTRPIDRSTAEWLRQLSASQAVYELASKRYVIVDDFTLKYNSKDDLFMIDMKYHYSDSFNSGLNAVSNSK